VVDGLDDVRDLVGTLLAGGVGDRDPLDVADERQDLRMIEDRRDRLAPAGLADQGEVGDRHRPAVLEGRHPAKLREPRAAPRGAVDDEPVADLEHAGAHVRR
jgi:hypothetical protein